MLNIRKIIGYLIFLFPLVFIQQSLLAGQIKIDTITSLALKDNKLGDPNTRNIVIYLPTGYESSDKVYPVIYLLHGFGGSERSFVDEVGENFAVFLLDNMIENNVLKEVIIVMPNAKNKYGGSYYLNSELIGNYEDYVAKEIVDYIDSNYRTIEDRDARAIAGASMGGYGGITLAMKYPETFSAVAVLSPPLGFDVMTEKIIPEILKENPNGMSGPNSKKQYTDYIYALSAALSPNLNNPPFFVDLPFEYPSGKVIEQVRQRWIQSDPLNMLSIYSSFLKSMKGIYIDVGDKDLLGFKEAADAFHLELLRLGIDHVYDVFQGGHSDNGVERAVKALRFLSDLLPESKTPSFVKSTLSIYSAWGYIKNMNN